MSARDKTRRQYPGPARGTVESTPEAVERIFKFVILSIFGGQRWWVGLQKRRWLGPRTTSWLRDAESGKLVRSGHTRHGWGYDSD